MINGAIQLEQAHFKVMPGGDTVPIQFNPASLQYTIQNTLSEPSGKGTTRQYVKQSSGKLTMDIVYDTSSTGADVRSMTEKVAKLMDPVPDSGGGRDAKKYPPVVQFEWGVYTFKGMVESYRETIDFFAANGVPLRASINLTLSSQTDVFTEGHASDAHAAQLAPTAVFDSATSVATRGGDPSAARSLASANDLDSLRFTDGEFVAIGGSVNLQGPAAFASASAGIGMGMGGGIGVGAGFGIGVSGGIGVGASAGAGIGMGGGVGIGAGAGFSASAGAGFSAGAGAGFSIGGDAGFDAGAGVSAGASAGFSASAGMGISAGAVLGSSASSAGVTASAGAFAGLRTSPVVKTKTVSGLNVSRIRSQVQFGSPTMTNGAVFGAGGKALQEGSAGLSTNVKANIGLAGTLQFGE